MDIINLGDIKISNRLPFVLIAGPCQIESLDHALFTAEKLLSISAKLSIPFIYKSSFDKANRTSISGVRGVGIDRGLEILSKVKAKLHCPIITDIHKEDQCEIVAEVADILQIPAFLCRQTDLLRSAAETKKIINVKKGQFLAPWDMRNVLAKLQNFGSTANMLTERGTCFGYNNLVSDMRSLVIMAETKAPVIFDATHSVQQPSSFGGSSGGQREYVGTLAKAAISVGVAGLFMEVHQDPDNAPSDGACMLRIDHLESLLVLLKQYDAITKH